MYRNEGDVVKETYFDVAIVGAGISGLYTALMLPASMKIGIFSKGGIQETNSYLAQGGVAASILKTGDCPAAHFEDTMKSGRNANKREAVVKLVSEAEETIHALESLGVQFDCDTAGNYLMGMEGAHSVARILRIGDYTGRSIMETLSNEVIKRENILWETAFTASSLIVNQGICYGIRGFQSGGEEVIYAKETILATGGIGNLYTYTSNNEGIDGSGIAMAIRAGVQMEGMRLTQFHPTVFFTPDLKGRQFLISEAVRGEGAVLRNQTRERFMCRYDRRLELAPRDVVSSAIEMEMKKTKSPFVYLDATHLDKWTLNTRFPTIYAFCQSQGILMERDLIPVAPRMHYFMGGIKTELNSRTSLQNLHAVGECACTGVHGRNRLASNSLLEALVYGKSAALDISRNMAERSRKMKDRHGQVDEKRVVKSEKTPVMVQPISHQIMLSSLKREMDTHMGINREKKSLLKLLSDIKEKRDRLDLGGKTLSSLEALMVDNALAVMESMIEDELTGGEQDESNHNR